MADAIARWRLGYFNLVALVGNEGRFNYRMTPCGTKFVPVVASDTMRQVGRLDE